MSKNRTFERIEYFTEDDFNDPDVRRHFARLERMRKIVAEAGPPQSQDLRAMWRWPYPPDIVTHVERLIEAAEVTTKDRGWMKEIMMFARALLGAYDADDTDTVAQLAYELGRVKGQFDMRWALTSGGSWSAKGRAKRREKQAIQESQRIAMCSRFAELAELGCVKAAHRVGLEFDVHPRTVYKQLKKRQAELAAEARRPLTADETRFVTIMKQFIDEGLVAGSYSDPLSDAQ